ncbi:MAG: IPT/TIG domain-containing protein [Bryobacteraceae bacterium]
MKSFACLFVFAGLVMGARLKGVRPSPAASVWFEPNTGFVKGRTEFVGRTRGAYLYMTGSAVVYAMAPEVVERGAKMRRVQMEFDGASSAVLGRREEATGGYSNYFVGKNSDEWFTGVPHYGRLRYREVYPGIDVVYYGVGGSIEFDFVVKAGADVSRVGMRFHGASPVTVGEDVVVNVEGSEMRLRRPRVFQGGVEIPSWYAMEDGVVRVRMAGVDASRELTIDPVLDFSTYLGGPGEDSFWAMTAASDGNPVLAGGTQSPASPTLDPFQQPSVVSLAPIILKMTTDGRRVVFYTILGRNAWESANVITTEKDGSLIVGGSTNSANFPLRNAFQTEIHAAYWISFVTKLSPDGRTLVYSSYLGGGNTDYRRGVLVDRAGDAWYLLSACSADFPTRSGIQNRHGGGCDGAIVKVSPTGTMLYSTFFGGAHFQGFQDGVQAADGTVCLAAYSHSGEVPLVEPIQTVRTARDGHGTSMLVRISEDGSRILYSSFVGGTTTGWAQSIGLDSDGNIWLAGDAGDRGLPVVDAWQSEYLPGMANGYLMKLDPTGKKLLYSSYLNGMSARDLLIDKLGNIYVGGLGMSPEFVLKDSLQGYLGGGILQSDHAVMKFAPGAQALIYSTLIGSKGNEQGVRLAPAGDGSVFVAGVTLSNDYPTKSAYQPDTGGSSDGVLFRLTDNSAPQIPAFTTNPGQLTFRFVQGDSLPVAQLVTVNGASGLVASTVEAWLRVTPSLAVSVVPAGLAPGIYRGTVRLTPPTGVAGTVSVTLNVLAAAPLLTAVEPARVAIGTDDTEITLRGSGFTNKTTVQLATLPWLLSPVRFVDSTTLRLTLPKPYFSAETNHSITVSNPDSAVSKAVSLAVGRPAPSIASRGIVSAASFAGDVISPGEIITLFGENFEAGMRVNFDGLLATPLYVTPGQLSVIAPVGLTGDREVNVVVEMNFDWRSVPVRIPVWPARPGLFTADSSGRGFAAALNQEGSVNSISNPADRGSIVVLWGTGGGVEALPVKVFVDGMESEVLYSGGKDGLWQVNVRIPEFAVKGEVVWRVGERESQDGVFVALRE